MSWSSSLQRVKPRCGGRRRRLCCLQAISKRERRRESCFHYLNGYHCGFFFCHMVFDVLEQRSKFGVELGGIGTQAP